MAIHSTPASMLKESLDELLEAATYCSEYRKTDEKWGDFKTGGCLGYPGAILLFAIVDSIGSYFRKNKNLIITIDSRKVTIDKDGWEHFKILNSKYFKQNLSEAFIRALYLEFRSYLTHNSVLGKYAGMVMNTASLERPYKGCAFFQMNVNDSAIHYWTSIKELLDLCKYAVQEFKKDIDDVIPTSRQGKEFH